MIFNFRCFVFSFSNSLTLFSGVGNFSGIVPPNFSIVSLTALPTLLWVLQASFSVLTLLSFNNASGVIGGVAALLIITLSIPADNTFTYVIARVFETFCGVFIAILVNYDYDWLLKHLK